MNNLLNKEVQSRSVFIPQYYNSTSRTDFPILNSISSEFRSPVMIIQSNIDFLKRFCNYSDTSLVNETFSFCEDSIGSIRGFIEKINILFTSDFSHVKPKREWYSLRLLIKQVFAELSHQNLDIRRITISNLVDDFNIFPDKYLLIRIIVNLLSNALKYSDEEVALLVSQSGSELLIVVRDSGIGIPLNQVPEIFNPFMRGRNVESIEGSGLGLPVVANAVKGLNGIITLHTEVAKGTEFRINIPNLQILSDFIPLSQNNELPENFDIGGLEYSQFIGTISHELRSPVAILKSNIQLLNNLTFEFDDELKHESISQCEASLNDMERLLEKITLLNISIKSGMKAHQPSQVLANCR